MTRTTSPPPWRPPPHCGRRVHPVRAAPGPARPAGRAGAAAAQLRRDGGRRHGALRRLGVSGVRLPPGAGRRRLAAPPPEPRPSGGPRRRSRHPGGAAPPRGHDGGDRSRRAARARGFLHLAVPGHRAPPDRGHRPAELAGQVPERIAHTHFKDVDLVFARQVQDGRLTYTEAVRDGLYRPLGRVTSTSPPSWSTCGATTTRAGTRSSRTPSSPSSPVARDLWPTYASAWSTSAGCSTDQTLRRYRSRSAGSLYGVTTWTWDGIVPGRPGMSPPAWSSKRQARRMSARRSWWSTAEMRGCAADRGCPVEVVRDEDRRGPTPSSSNAVSVALFPPPAEYTASIDGCRPGRRGPPRASSGPARRCRSPRGPCVRSQLRPASAGTRAPLLLATERGVAHRQQHVAVRPAHS